MNRLVKLVGSSIEEVDTKIRELNLDGWIVIQIVSLKCTHRRIHAVLLLAKKSCPAKRLLNEKKTSKK